MGLEEVVILVEVISVEVGIDRKEEKKEEAPNKVAAVGVSVIQLSLCLNSSSSAIRKLQKYARLMCFLTPFKRCCHCRAKIK